MKEKDIKKKLKSDVAYAGRGVAEMKKMKPAGYFRSGEDFYPVYNAKQMIEMFKLGFKYHDSPEKHLLDAIFGKEDDDE